MTCAWARESRFPFCVVGGMCNLFVPGMYVCMLYVAQSEARLTQEQDVPVSIPCPATNIRFSFR